MVAEAFEKIRINPGNFVDGRKTFDVIDFEDDLAFKAEQEQIREVLSRLQEIRVPAFGILKGEDGRAE